MEHKTNLKELMKISEPKLFKKGAYICSEGEEGEEMYIVLQGKVAIYINSFMDENVKVAEAGPGEFFGEMAIFEKKARSASCVAEEDTSCIAIRDSNLRELIACCPEIVEKLLYGLSGRVREMNDKLYKSGEKEKSAGILPFSVPQGHKSAAVRSGGDKRYLHTIRVVCPLCGSHITGQSIDYQKLKVTKVRPDQRKMFDKPDVLWYYIRTCPECGYSNFYVDFGQTRNMPVELAKEVVAEENKYLAAHGGFLNPFDKTAARFYKAIHFNQCIFGENSFLIGKLWLYLYWFYEDAGNEEMVSYCADQVIFYYTDAYETHKSLLKREYDKQQCAMVIAEMYYLKKDFAEAKVYYHEVMNYTNSSVYDQAYERICELRKAEQKNGLI